MLTSEDFSKVSKKKFVNANWVLFRSDTAVSYSLELMKFAVTGCSEFNKLHQV